MTNETIYQKENAGNKYPLLEELSVSNGSKEDFLSKKKNIWLGVSVSLKPYSEGLAREYLKIISENSKEKALVFIADEIAAINYKVLGGYGSEKSLRKAKEQGETFNERFQRLIGSLPVDKQRKIKVVRWGDLWDKEKQRQYEILKEEYLVNPEFQKEVEAPVITYLINSGRGTYENRVRKMAEYILRELPFLLDGVKHEGISYDAMLYPTYGKTSLSKVVTAIQRGERFGELKEKLGIGGKHVLADSYIKVEDERGYH